MFTRAKNKIQCYCKICNGKFVDERTRNYHAKLKNYLAFNIPGFIPFLPPSHDSSRSNLKTANIEYNTIVEGSRKIKMDEQESRLLEDDNCYEPALANLEQYFSLKK